MKRIVLCGWSVGFEKVGLTKLLRDRVGLSLSKAKGITDAVLKSQSVNIEVLDEEFEAVVSVLTDLGVKFTLDSGGSPDRRIS